MKNVRNLFEFVKGLEELKHEPVRSIDGYPWHLSLTNLPRHPTVRVGIEPGILADGTILSVKRPDIPPVPRPSDELLPWIDGSLGDPAAPPTLKDALIRMEADGQSRFDPISSYPVIERQGTAWLALWHAWATDAALLVRIRALYIRLFELRALLEGRSHQLEAVVGDALLTWSGPWGEIRHPLLVRRAEVQFDPETATIAVVDTTDATELVTSIVRGMAIPSGAALRESRLTVDRSQLHPLGTEVDQTLGIIRNLWFPTADVAPPGETAPRFERAPLLLVRPAGQRAIGMLEAILDDLAKVGANAPDPLAWIAGDAKPPADAEATPGEQAHGSAAFDERDIAFVMPSNTEQLVIARQVARRKAVNVQGPPGTGKTHTIANLIGHFLAQGKTVLVTSQTSKALGEVRSKVPERLRSLCIALLDSDRESKAQLDHAITGILRTLQETDRATLLREAEGLRVRRNQQLTIRDDLRRRLLAARQSEIDVLVIDGTETAPIHAAKWLHSQAETLAWIPAPVSPAGPCPLGPEDLVTLFRSNGALSSADERELAGTLPNPTTLISVVALDASLARERGAAATAGQDQVAAWTLSPTADATSVLEALHARLTQVIAEVDSDVPWQLQAVHDGQSGAEHRAHWDALIVLARETDAVAVKARAPLLTQKPSLGAGADPATDLPIAQAILLHLEAGGSLSFLTLLGKPSWKRSLERWQVASGAPRAVEHLTALVALLRLQTQRQELRHRWQQLIGSQGGMGSDTLGAELEATVRELVDHLGRLLSWHRQEWLPLAAALTEAGLRVEPLVRAHPPIAHPQAALLRILRVAREVLLPAVAARLAACSLLLQQQERAACVLSLRHATALHPGSTCLRTLADAVESGDVDAYRHGCERLAELHGLCEIHERRQALLGRLRSAAPAWAAAIAARDGHHGATEVPADVAGAWRWRQVHDELERRAAVSPGQLSHQLEQCQQDLADITEQLVFASAWARQHDRSSGEARQALQGWRTTMARIGAGTGARVPELQAEAAKLLVQARDSVPVWIMPLYRIFQTIDPTRRPRFDVVIVDEASQVDVSGLLALYLGEQVIVVGDEEQVTPLAIGQTISDARTLRAQHLVGVPNDHLYDGKLSLYDLAQQSFGAGTVTLREHFRCVPDIIAFSNHLCYLPKGKPILPLREPTMATLRPHLIPHRVRGVCTPQKTNEEGAETIASLLGAMIRNKAYEGATFGVISMVGDQQANLIDRLVRTRLRLSEEDIERLKGGGGATRRLCGDPPQFQGDERRVILLSLVDASVTDDPLRLKQMDVYTQRFNVAASRAQDQMWVVHSLDHTVHLQASDLRRRLIEHALDPQAVSRSTAALAQQVESPFELAIAEALVAAGYRVQTQYRVGAYRIDLVASDGQRRLAIECDGERFHPPEALAQDLQRQATLERLGWQFHRIRGSLFYRNPARALLELTQRLAEVGVLPIGPAVIPVPAAEDLSAVVLREAALLRAAWAEEASEAPVTITRPQRKSRSRSG